MKIIAKIALVFLLLLVLLLNDSLAQVHPDTYRVLELLKNAPKTVDLEIEYREIKGLGSKAYKWYIGQSTIGITLHPKERFDIEKLDKNKKYIITGTIVGQNYNGVEVWVEEIREKK